ncbi:MAG: hypothetical protein HY721_34445 [Planctomycetes bacterium]|nr:hypothetical protein [Planctomycetota bacterium]
MSERGARTATLEAPPLADSRGEKGEIRRAKGETRFAKGEAREALETADAPGRR